MMTDTIVRHSTHYCGSHSIACCTACFRDSISCLILMHPPNSHFMNCMSTCAYTYTVLG